MTFSPIFKVDKAAQLAKGFSIETQFVALKFILVSPSQLKNARAPMLITDSGIVTDGRYVQS